MTALYVDVDCDIYTSTRDALGWMYRHRKIAKGTVLGYDDWGGGHYGGRWYGEARAHQELTSEYRVTLKPVAPRISNSGVIFRVVEILGRLA